MNHIDTLKNIKAGFEKDEWMADDVEALDCAIKALKNQKSVITELEKIKAEIDALYEVYEPYFKERLVIKSDVIQILDKHITELKGSD